ncbi:MAG TPA: histidinol dehydrogenase [Ktedonobacterales bacterium]|nr:histidinol dehydrogenase [Ktedonobacterales bacterium]
MASDLDLEIEALEDLSAARRAALLDRGRDRLRALREPVARILADVRARGDAAVLEYAARFDVAPAHLRVPEDEIAAALAAADPDYLAALGQAITNIEAFHRAQLDALLAEEPVETAPGVRLWRVWRPIARVGVYVPGGGALYPSCLLMSAIPARVAGCFEVAVCTPPGADGRVPAPVLAAAALAGVDEVYAVGGAQAIGALAYGTATIAAVDKICGPGGSYVAAAKALVAGEVATDLPAGPSEVLVLADATANPAWVAADLLAQAEHGPESACVLVTDSATLAERVRAEIQRQLPALASAPVIRESLRRNGALLVAQTLMIAIAFANKYAPEHLEVLTAEPEALLGAIWHAGAVFLGGWSPVPAGDYASGGNHTLPTARYARGFGPLAVEAFGRRMQVQRLSREGLSGIRASIEKLATTEGLPGHAAAARIRFDPAAAPAQEAEA